MSARDVRRHESKDKEISATAQNLPVHPLKPRPKLFLILLILFIAWIGIMLAMYFTTVYPERYPSATTQARHVPG